MNFQKLVHMVQYRQPRAMIAVCISSKLVFHLVALKIRPLSQLDDPVFRHCSIPHKIASVRVVLRILFRR